LYAECLTDNGGERDPVIFPAFKAGDSALREPSGGFDSHTLPPQKANKNAMFQQIVPEL